MELNTSNVKQELNISRRLVCQISSISQGMTAQSYIFELLPRVRSILVLSVFYFQYSDVTGCPCENHQASEEERTLTSPGYPSAYSPFINCRYAINKPNVLDGYYFEMKWHLFDVRGKMPDCREDFVEIFIGNESKSLGRFCSGGVQSLHPIYTIADTVIVLFRSNAESTGTGFVLSYKLKPLQEFISDKSSSTSGLKSGIISSNDWPSSLKRTKSRRFFVLKPHENIRITFMDIDLRKRHSHSSKSRICDRSSTSVVISGYNQSSGWISSIRYEIACTDRAPKIFVLNTNNVVVRVDLERSFRALRGFIAGYVVFYTDVENTKTEAYDKTVVVSLLTGVSIGILITVAVYIVVNILIKKKIL